MRLIDQTRLPVEFVEIECRKVEAVWEAIKTLRVRGAPAIGIAAAYGVCLGVQSASARIEAAFFRRLDEVADYLATSRPTAVNLFWALERMARGRPRLRGRADGRSRRARCWPRPARSTRRTGRCAGPSAATGPRCSADGQGVLTHCNAGGLATADYGTALAVSSPPPKRASGCTSIADETRPLLQGARLDRLGTAASGGSTSP